MNRKILFLRKYKINLSTRKTARLIFDDVLNKKYPVISFKNIDFASRSFLDEIFVLSEKYEIEIVDMSSRLRVLYDIIRKSHEENRIYAPILRIKKIQTLSI